MIAFLKELHRLIFGKNYEPIWQKFALENNGTHLNPGVEIFYKQFRILFDTYTYYTTVGGSTYQKEYTRVRVEFVPTDGLQVRITRHDMIDSISKLFGVQDIKVGDIEFDKKFVIKGNDEFKIQSLFNNIEIRKLLLAQTDPRFETAEKRGFFDEEIKDEIALLYFTSEDKIKTVRQLNDLYKLHQQIIDDLINLRSIKNV